MLADERHVPVVVDVREEMNHLLVHRGHELHEAQALGFARQVVEEHALAGLVGGADRADQDLASVGEVPFALEVSRVVGHRSIDCRSRAQARC